MRTEVFTLLGNTCSKCGYSENTRALQIDHIEGGGAQETRDIGRWGILKKIRDQGKEGYQLLCANCNMIKKYESDKESNRKYNKRETK